MICRLIFLMGINFCVIVTVVAQEVPGWKSLTPGDYFVHQSITNRYGKNFIRFHANDSASLFKINRLFNSPYDFTTNKIPANYYTTHFGFFCKRELEVEKITCIALRFRLGSLHYCNMLEGKL